MRPTVRLIAAAAAILTAGLLAGSCAVNPATGQRQLALLSEGQEIAMGRQADEEIRTSLGLYPDEELQRYVEELGRELAGRSERPDLPWRFRVVDDPVVNAFALPGGFIYVTRGILAHFDSEAQLASVLGHEIGHVTGRHSVEQLSRAQLATLGLGVAMIASEDLREIGGLAQAGLGLLFLKFGRDDERQADDLGLRYMVRAGYDASEMPEVFATLDRVSAAQGGGRIPDWLSTHPNPADRARRIAQQADALFPDERGTLVRREEYLRRLDGLVFGPDPREGFFQENVFYHPGLAFRLTLPAGWPAVNGKQAVRAVSPRQDGEVVLSLAGRESPAAAARAFFASQGVEEGRAWGPAGFYHFRTLDGAGGETSRGIVGFFEHRGAVFQLRGRALPDAWAEHAGPVTASLESFRNLTDRRYLEVEPKRLEVVRLDRAMTLAELAAERPSTVDLQTLAIANGVAEDALLPAGRLVKRVVGGELP